MSISEDGRRRYRLGLLQQGSIKHLYQRRLDSALAEAPPPEDIEEEYSNIKLALKKSAHEALGYEQKRKIQKAPIWLTDEVKQSIDEMKNVITTGFQIRPTLTGRDTKQKTEKRVKPSKNRKPINQIEETNQKYNLHW
ncbi:hypothetical protein HHI36_011786 [Cryptolaemus montrouzieri]|uniref:Uncharacterized protein n=1 Tax=Cryptolaemus montrouzieri TaxID=559131 RepID=A0ABD2ND42_9CUCU